MSPVMSPAMIPAMRVIMVLVMNGAAEPATSGAAGPARATPEGAGTPVEIRRLTDRFVCTGPLLFSQLPYPVHPLAEQAPNPRSTCAESVQ
jgi:hypothetical protein